MMMYIFAPCLDANEKGQISLTLQKPNIPGVFMRESISMTWQTPALYSFVTTVAEHSLLWFTFQLYIDDDASRDFL